MKVWKKGDIYNFYVEFNRIESYNKYCQEQLKYYAINVDIINKTDWNIYDIVDLNDFNRVKRNINILLNAVKSNEQILNISSQVNQVWNYEKANEIEQKLKSILDTITNWQFAYEITGLAILGNDMRLGGVE